jgi:3-isopropylmalate dehydrogenase
MLEYLGYASEAARIEAAVTRAITANETTTDIGGSLGTIAAGDAILGHLKSM